VSKSWGNLSRRRGLANTCGFIAKAEAPKGTYGKRVPPASPASCPDCLLLTTTGRRSGKKQTSRGKPVNRRPRPVTSRVSVPISSPNLAQHLREPADVFSERKGSQVFERVHLQPVMEPARDDDVLFENRTAHVLRRTGRRHRALRAAKSIEAGLLGD
jgi:hypothetical protein